MSCRIFFAAWKCFQGAKKVTTTHLSLPSPTETEEVEHHEAEIWFERDSSWIVCFKPEQQPMVRINSIMCHVLVVLLQTLRVESTVL